MKIMKQGILLIVRLVVFLGVSQSVSALMVLEDIVIYPPPDYDSDTVGTIPGIDAVPDLADSSGAGDPNTNIISGGMPSPSPSTPAPTTNFVYEKSVPEKLRKMLEAAIVKHPEFEKFKNYGIKIKIVDGLAERGITHPDGSHTQDVGAFTYANPNKYPLQCSTRRRTSNRQGFCDVSHEWQTNLGVL